MSHHDLQSCLSQRLNQRISSRATAGLFQQNRPIADKRGRGWIVRYVPIATDAPQQKCYSIGDGNTHIHDIHIPVGEPPQHQ
jgi:hypothetical protein